MTIRPACTIALLGLSETNTIGYYACTELGQRLFALPLGPLALACLARNRAEDHARMDEILVTEGREGFAAAWLRAQGFPEAARSIEEKTHAALVLLAQYPSAL